MAMRSPATKKKTKSSPFNSKSHSRGSSAGSPRTNSKSKLIDGDEAAVIFGDGGSDIEIDDDDGMMMDNDAVPPPQEPLVARNSSPAQIAADVRLTHPSAARNRSSDNVLLIAQRKDPSIESLTANLQKKRMEAAKFQKMLQKGRPFIKINKLSKPGQRFISVSHDMQYILIFKDEQDWKAYQSNPIAFRKNSGLKNSITDSFRRELCSDLTDVRKGPSEELLRKSKQYGSPAELIFSLRFKSKVIDLEVETEADRDVWHQCFNWLKDFSRDSLVSGPVNVKHVAHVDSEFKWSGNDFEDQIELKKKIGEGAFGEVYVGVHKTTNLEFAIKMLDFHRDDFPDRNDDSKVQLSPEFEQEIGILKQCRHPNIVNFYGIWGPDRQDRLWIMMDFCAFGAVTDLLRIADMPISEDQIKWLLSCTLRGLAYLHSKAIIHRDIKPNNILVDNGGVGKIADFGVSNQLSKYKSRVFSKKLLGTPLFMAPEVLGKGEVSWRADIWALGISAIELADGVNPYSELGAFAAIAFIQSNPAPKLSEKWSNDFRDFVSCMLQKNPEDRWSAYDLLQHPFLTGASNRGMMNLVIKYADNVCLTRQDKLNIMKDFQEAEAKQALTPAPQPPASSNSPELPVIQEQQVREPEPAYPMIDSGQSSQQPSKDELVPPSNPPSRPPSQLLEQQSSLKRIESPQEQVAGAVGRQESSLEEPSKMAGWNDPLLAGRTSNLDNPRGPCSCCNVGVGGGSCCVIS
eukprot:TRINITY_DN5208_c0_g1_i1.p1 TRINITY_DN5208_c0_g1~~TRINITY_DN5208_c0_g1_i1.p1  ORF type:complete len:763 (-),score=166.95 TRINITY_DN5208_c0_g1_i1:15-2243(-)